MTVTALSLSASSLSVQLQKQTVLADVSVTVAPGEVVGLVGANGSGKSTLLRCLAGLRQPDSGQVLLDGQNLRQIPAAHRARSVALVEQSAATDTDLRVADVVALGRIPHRSRWSASTAIDDDIVLHSLAEVSLESFAHRRWATLSGGERQRVHLARAFAQQAGVLLLDEPTNHLDIRHQFELMDLLVRSHQTVVVVLHDLTLAAAYCDRVMLLHEGHNVATGEPREVLTPQSIATVFGVDAVVGEAHHPLRGSHHAVRLTGVAERAPTTTFGSRN